MTAAGLDALSGGRAILGLGASGPQVIEGFHGVPYDKPVARTREIIEICRKVWRRERLEHTGIYTMPLPPDQGTGLGKALKLINHPRRADIPIWVAALGDKNLAMTAELATGWLPHAVLPEKMHEVFGPALATGFAKRAPELGPLQITGGGFLALEEEMFDAGPRRRPQRVRAVHRRHGRPRPQLLQHRLPPPGLRGRGRPSCRTSTSTARRPRRPRRCPTTSSTASR